jgi:hypothetical protein
MLEQIFKNIDDIPCRCWCLYSLMWLYQQLQSFPKNSIAHLQYRLLVTAKLYTYTPTTRAKEKFKLLT